MSEPSEPGPQRSKDAWVADDEPAGLSTREGTRRLVTEAGPKLRALDFDDEQIWTWAEAYIERYGAGSVEQFVSWIKHQQS